MNKGCNNCKNYKIGELKMWEPDIPSKCLLGKNEEFHLWWEDSHNKEISQTKDMDCFEERESSILLNEVLEKMDELAKELGVKL
jgi:hypothetical protein